MKITNTFFLTAISFAVITLGSCSKDDTGSNTKAVFSYVADGYKVNFTNFSSNATEYRWDFGDGSGVTSTARTPQHIFTAKGNYLVSLTAKNGADSSVFKDTVTIIGPNIRIDGDYSDWEYVEYLHENTGSGGGTLLAVKAFASSDRIYFYLEGTQAMNLELFDMYMDADNNPATGFSTWMYPAGSGADYLFEGPPDANGTIFKHEGPPAGFTFSPSASFAEAMSFSAVTPFAGKKRIEFSVKKSALGSLSGAVNFSFIELTSGWADIGKIPVAALPESKFITLPL